MQSRLAGPRFALLLLLAALALPAPALAQYFGRNKVTYRTFDFRILKTEHFDLYYYPEERLAAEQAGRMAERWYARLSTVLGHELSNRQPLVLYASHPHFEQTNAIPGTLEESTGGVTESLKRRIVLPLGSSLGETDHVIGHELVHAFQYDMGGRVQGSPSPAIERLPLWFIEGMAEYLSLGPVDAHTAMWMRDAVWTNKTPTIAKLSDPHYFPYRFGHAFWAYVGRRWGDRAISEVLRTAARAGDAELAFRAQLGVGADTLSLDWKATLDKLAAAVPRRDASVEGKTLVSARGDVGRYNLAPAFSPDGKWVMFLSERSLFTMELFLADARTGAIKRRVTKTAVDAHLQSLQFIAGSGAWSPDSRQFAFSSVRDGQAAIQIVTVPKGRTTKVYKLRNLDEVLSLSWSPDGRTLALSALTGGHTDIYTLDLQLGTIVALTSDLAADLQPAWSPDGKQLAFSTERFSTALDSLAIGLPEIAVVTIADGSVQQLPALEGCKHINPQWSGDGRSVYAVVDYGGISNIHRLDIESGRWHQVTAVSTGVSGIASFSPSISISAQADRMVFAAYQDGSYNLYMIDQISKHGESLPKPPEFNAALLVPPDLGQDEMTVAQPAPSDSVQKSRSPSITLAPPVTIGEAPTVTARPPLPGPFGEDPRVEALLRNRGYGLADTSNFQHSRYRPRLSLDRVSQVSVGVAAGSGAGFAGAGGAGLFWSDMLGDHNLGTYLEINSTGGDFARSIAAVVSYQNLRRRWNWGVEASQLPYVTRFISVDFDTLPDQSIGYRQTDTRSWEIERRFGGVVAYPFSRADRIEFSGSFRNIDFEQEQEIVVIDAFGNLVAERTVRSSQPGLSLYGVGLAFAHDNAYFGGTSPIIGSRYRFGVEPTLGGLEFTGLLADYRHYYMPRRPWTLAFRVLHYGRYGRDEESSLLSPLFLGYSNLMRGYDDQSFSPEEVGPDPNNPSTEFERLFGSRIAVGNLELRVPILGAFSLTNTGALPPVEFAVFGDAGTAWTRSDVDDLLNGRGRRRLLSSHGVATRINVFGFLVAEIDYVHPNDRPRKSWYWQFSIQPGF